MRELPKGKFDGVDTLPMFDEPDHTPTPRRQAMPRSVAFGSCPNCTAQRVGLVRGPVHLVWRTHTYRTYSGATIPCRASGVPVCAHPPARDYLGNAGNDTTRCTCETLGGGP
jgi:hypothetical protein